MDNKLAYTEPPYPCSPAAPRYWVIGCHAQMRLRRRVGGLEARILFPELLREEWVRVWVLSRLEKSLEIHCCTSNPTRQRGLHLRGIYSLPCSLLRDDD